MCMPQFRQPSHTTTTSSMVPEFRGVVHNGWLQFANCITFWSLSNSHSLSNVVHMVGSCRKTSSACGTDIHSLFTAVVASQCKAEQWLQDDIANDVSFE